MTNSKDDEQELKALWHRYFQEEKRKLDELRYQEHKAFRHWKETR